MHFLSLLCPGQATHSTEHHEQEKKHTSKTSQVMFFFIFQLSHFFDTSSHMFSPTSLASLPYFPLLLHQTHMYIPALHVHLPLMFSPSTLIYFSFISLTVTYLLLPQLWFSSIFSSLTASTLNFLRIFISLHMFSPWTSIFFSSSTLTLTFLPPIFGSLSYFPFQLLPHQTLMYLLSYIHLPSNIFSLNFYLLFLHYP